MPTPKNGFQILNLHLKKHVFKKNTLFFNVLLPKYYPYFNLVKLNPFGTDGYSSTATLYLIV